MIHMVHVRDADGATSWLRQRRRHIAANPVPLLFVGVTTTHQDLQLVTTRAGIEGGFYIDATGESPVSAEVGSDILVLADRSWLDGAQAFVDRARRARQTLDIILVEDAVEPDLSWCGDSIDAFETWR